MAAAWIALFWDEWLTLAKRKIEQGVCPLCNEPVKPEPYHRREFRSPTADARKLREAKRWLKMFRRCSKCLNEEFRRGQAIQFQALKINQLLAEYKKTAELSHSGVIDALYSTGGAHAVALHLGLLANPKDGRKVSYEIFSDYSAGATYEHRTLDAIDYLVHLDDHWKSASDPAAYLAVSVRNLRSKWRREDELPVPRRPWPWTDAQKAEAEARLQSLLRKAGLDAEERRVFRMKMDGVTRERFLTQAETPAKRKRLQAAERRLSRKMQDVESFSWRHDVEILFNRYPMLRLPSGSTGVSAKQENENTDNDR